MVSSLLVVHGRREVIDAAILLARIITSPDIESLACALRPGTAPERPSSARASRERCPLCWFSVHSKEIVAADLLLHESQESSSASIQTTPLCVILFFPQIEDLCFVYTGSVPGVL